MAVKISGPGREDGDCVHQAQNSSLSDNFICNFYLFYIYVCLAARKSVYHIPCQVSPEVRNEH